MQEEIDHSIFKDLFKNEHTHHSGKIEPLIGTASLFTILDISGIQNFVYTVPSKYALKNLRARSFYLEILLRHIVDRLLTDLKLLQENLLYNGGGKAYLILPNTDKVKEALSRTQELVNNWLLANIGTTLYLAIATEVCDKTELEGKNAATISHFFECLSKTLEADKLRRYSTNQLKDLLSPSFKDNGGRECKVCKKSTSELFNVYDDDEGNEEDTCYFCASLVYLGQELVYTKNVYITITESSEEKPQKDEKSCKKPCGVLLPCRILDSNPEVKSIYFNVTADKVTETKYSINKTNNCTLPNIWLGNYVLKDDKDATRIVNKFDDLVKKAKGIQRLAMLRADVDDLGKAFREGFTGCDKIFSRLATLSYQLNMFFKKRVNEIADGKVLAVIYAGGDDLCVVGAWNDVIDFACDLKSKFADFSYEKLHFSAGIGFFHSTYPVYKMAEQTGQLEHKAKNNGKNAVSLFGEDIQQFDEDMQQDEKDLRDFTFKWCEFDKILKLKKDIEELDILDIDKKLTTSLLHTLLNLLLYIKQHGKINIARLAYSLARNVGDKNHPLTEKLMGLALDEQGRKKLVTIINLWLYERRGENNGEFC